MNTSDTNSVAINNSTYTSQNETIKKEKISGREIIIRVIDILGGLVGFFILVPLTLIVWILNKKNKEDRTNIFCSRTNRLKWKNFQNV